MGINKARWYCCILFGLIGHLNLSAQGAVACTAMLRSLDSVLAKPISKDNQAKMKIAKSFLISFIACENNAPSASTVAAQKKLAALETYFDVTIAGPGKGGWAQKKNLAYIMVDAGLQETAVSTSAFSSILEYHDGLALAAIKEGNCEGKSCFINEQGSVIISCNYVYPESFSGGFAKAQKNNLYGFINIEGRLVIPCKYDKVGTYSDGFAMVSKGGQYGFINVYGEEVIPLQYSFAGSFKSGLAKVVRDGKAGFISTNGREVIPAIYDEAQDNFTDSLAWVKKNGKWGFINTKGSTVVPLDYDRANAFSEGLACVIKGGKSGYISKDNTVVIPFEFEPNSVVPDFIAGMAYVIKDGKAFYIDHQGKKVKDAR